MTTTYSGFWVSRLTAEQRARTCGYWYTVTTYGATPHTAFKTRAGLDRWMRERGLKLTGGEALDNESGGTCRIEGTYRTNSHLYDADTFADLSGELTRTLSNGDYVVAVITTDYDGIRTVHTLNPNVRGRVVYDYRESDLMIS